MQGRILKYFLYSLVALLSARVGQAQTAAIQVKVSKNRSSENVEKAVFGIGELTGNPIAISRADLDGDGRDELLVLLDDLLLAYKVHRHSLSIYARLGLEHFPRSATRVRKPVGSLAAMYMDLDKREEIAFNTGSIAQGAIIYWSGLRFIRLDTLSGMPLAMGRRNDGKFMLLGKLAPGTSLYASICIKRLQMDQCDEQMIGQQSLAVTATRDLEYISALHQDGTVHTWGTDGVELPVVKNCGEALAVTELEGKGLPELVVSAPVLPPGPDRVKVMNLEGEGAPTPLWISRPIPGVVRAITTGGFESAASNEIIIAYTDEKSESGKTKLMEVEW
ncbi:MAG: hypothetical protein GXP49_10120 [Deltaproteobacteria bacterium]|nr:hypothetical protein [Deltaproteobacteria bacterium]